jgi:hypothetical protein
MLVCFARVSVSLFAVFLGRGGMRPPLFVMALFMLMCGAVMMMSCCRMVGRCVAMMLGRRMFCHDKILSEKPAHNGLTHE